VKPGVILWDDVVVKEIGPLQTRAFNKYDGALNHVSHKAGKMMGPSKSRLQGQNRLPRFPHWPYNGVVKADPGGDDGGAGAKCRHIRLLLKPSHLSHVFDAPRTQR
jgi:hypothetical protein